MAVVISGICDCCGLRTVVFSDRPIEKRALISKKASACGMLCSYCWIFL